MLMENELDQIVIEDHYEGSMDPCKVFTYICPKCRTVLTFNIGQIDDVVDCDLRNPSDELMICPNCEYEERLLNGATLYDKDSIPWTLFSDGTMLHMRDKDGKTWLI